VAAPLGSRRLSRTNWRGALTWKMGLGPVYCRVLSPAAVNDDAAETLYIMELKRGVAALPAARSLRDREVDALIRMVMLVWIV
jgi:hypothetical protein